MVKIRFQFLFGSFLALALSPKVGLAATADLGLTVSGTVLPTPQWQDASGKPIATLGFVFTGVAGSASTAVDSAAAVAKLENALAYPASISVTLPSTCSIGSTRVKDTDVAVLVSGSPASSTLTLPSNKSESFALRFAATGGYGDKSGVVSCANSGRMRYTY